MDLKKEAEELKLDWATGKGTEILPAYNQFGDDDRAAHLLSCDSTHAVTMEFAPIPPNEEEGIILNENVDTAFTLTCDHNVYKHFTVEMGIAQLVSEFALLATVKRMLSPEGIESGP